MQFHLALLCFGGSRNLRDGYLKTSADKTETIWMTTPHKGTVCDQIQYVSMFFSPFPLRNLPTYLRMFLAMLAEFVRTWFCPFNTEIVQYCCCDVHPSLCCLCSFYTEPNNGGSKSAVAVVTCYNSVSCDGWQMCLAVLSKQKKCHNNH